MNYVKAKNVLPSELLEKIQEYAAGTYLYIPQKCENRKNWGESKDSKNWYKRRNQRIYKNNVIPIQNDKQVSYFELRFGICRMNFSLKNQTK